MTLSKSLVSISVRAQMETRDLKRSIAKGEERSLKYGGGIVRNKARRSFGKPARGRRGRSGSPNLSHLPADEQRVLRQKIAIAKAVGRKPPRVPKPRRKPVAGKPPTAYTKRLKTIFYAFDRTDRTVPVGAMLYGPGTVSLLEHGGRGIVTTTDGKKVRARYRAFPFMQPAMESSKDQIAQGFRNSVRR